MKYSNLVVALFNAFEYIEKSSGMTEEEVSDLIFGNENKLSKVEIKEIVEYTKETEEKLDDIIRDIFEEHSELFQDKLSKN